MLSEKAKGKQRVVEQSGAPEPPGQVEPLAKPLVVRFTEGFQDLSLQVEHKDTVRDLKRKVGPYASYVVAAYAFRFERLNLRYKNVACVSFTLVGC